MVVATHLRKRKLTSAPKPTITKLGAAWLSTADALARLAPAFDSIGGAQAAIADCLRAGKLRAFAEELNVIDADDWGIDAQRDVSRANSAGFVHQTWLGPYPESICLTEDFWRQSPDASLETPSWDWTNGHFVAGMFGKNMTTRERYWIARSIVFNAFEIECLSDKRRMGYAISSEAGDSSLPSANEPGRPPSPKWSNWIALWVWHCLHNELSKDLDPDALAGVIDQRLKDREVGRVDRRAAKAAIQATLNYVCSGKGKSPNPEFSE